MLQIAALRLPVKAFLPLYTLPWKGVYSVARGDNIRPVKRLKTQKNYFKKPLKSF